MFHLAFSHYLKSGFITIVPQHKSFLIKREHNKRIYSAGPTFSHAINMYIYRISSILAQAILFKLPFGSKVFEKLL